MWKIKPTSTEAEYFCLQSALSTFSQMLDEIEYMTGKPREIPGGTDIMFWTLQIINYKKFLHREVIDITWNDTLDIFLKAMLYHRTIGNSGWNYSFYSI